MSQLRTPKVDHLRDDRMGVFVLHDLRNFSDECIGVIH